MSNLSPRSLAQVDECDNLAAVTAPVEMSAAPMKVRAAAMVPAAMVPAPMPAAPMPAAAVITPSVPAAAVIVASMPAASVPAAAVIAATAAIKSRRYNHAPASAVWHARAKGITEESGPAPSFGQDNPRIRAVRRGGRHCLS